MMNLIPRPHATSKDLFSELLDFQNQMNDLFDFSLGRRADRGRWTAQPGWLPAVDVHEEKDRYVVKADVPGLTRDDLSISIEDGVLTLKGEKKQENESSDKDVLRSERFYGAFARAIQLPGAVDASGVKAVYKNGVVDIAIPKREDAKPKSVKIEIA
jgi:HSP20 family protein